MPDRIYRLGNVAALLPLPQQRHMETKKLMGFVGECVGDSAGLPQLATEHQVVVFGVLHREAQVVVERMLQLLFANRFPCFCVHLDRLGQDPVEALLCDRAQQVLLIFEMVVGCGARYACAGGEAAHR